MRTDDLINALSMDVQPVDGRQVSRSIGSAVVLGGAAALMSIILTLGIRSDLAEADASTSLALKLLFTLAIVVTASYYLTRLAHPGGERRARVVVAALPLVAIGALGAITLAFAPRAHWNEMIVGNQWLECLISIPVIAILPFLVIVWAVRRAAPTDLAKTGAVAGLVAGGVSATAYALHCTDDSLPFVATWYGGTITLCTVVGAKLGPRLLRW